MLMKYLSLHPAVVVARRHPYEVKLASYYAAALGVLSATADRENSTDPERMISQHLHVGFNPYNRPSYYSIAKNHKAVEHYFEVEAPARTASTFRDLVLRYYELLADDEGKPSADCFAEKITLHERARLGVRALFPKVRELVLVRDPRDLLCSARAFWGLDPASSLASVAHASRALLDLYQAAEPDVRFVRYEDLVMEPTRTMADVFAFIGLYPSHAPEYGDQKGESFDIHATSKSPEASVGRWRKELSASEVSQCQDASRPYLLAFHYE